MDTNHRERPNTHSTWNRVAIGFICIIVGLLFLGRNLGWISGHLFHILVSWQIFLIVLGVLALLKRNISSGITLLAVGGFFLIPHIFQVGYSWVGDYWPVFLIIGGVGLLFSMQQNAGRRNRSANQQAGVHGLTTEDGYIVADAYFSGVKHIVHDPSFSGAKLTVSFGSVALDLRRTQLKETDTYIDIHNSFGGVELFVPSSWNVTSQANAIFAGIEDKRLQRQEVDYTHRLIIRGQVIFGGVEIKN